LTITKEFIEHVKNWATISTSIVVSLEALDAASKFGGSQPARRKTR
jgi:hypothetical protein